MGSPDRILVPYDDYRFDRVGKLADGRQFIAKITGAFPEGYKLASDESWRDVKQWIAVLHLFDSDGEHIRTVSKLVALDRDIHKLAESDNILDELLKEHGVVNEEYGDIKIKLFSVNVNGIRHSLTYHCVPNDNEDSTNAYEYVDFQPFGVAFNPPWDSGLYDT